MKILLVIYDNGSYVNNFPLGSAYIATALENNGHDVTIYNQDVYHYPEEHLIEYLNNNEFDFIGLSFIAGYYQYRKIIKICEAIHKSKTNAKIILGGHGPSPEPEYFLRKVKADYVVIGEGENTICDLVNGVSNPNGIAYIDNNDNFIQTKPRELIKDIDSISYPAYHKFPMDHYILMRESGYTKTDRTAEMLSGRGCPFKCNFCFRLDKGFRPRSAKSIIEEIKFLKKEYRITSVTFLDDLLMSSVKRTTELCELFIKEKLNIKWHCNGRLNYAELNLLKLMEKAGCVFINYGIECLSDEVLKTMKKNLTVEQIIKGVENTLKTNIRPGLNVIFGNIGEDIHTLRNGVDFLKKYSGTYQMRTIRPVTPYPGSPLYYYAIKKGLLKDIEDFYENKHVNSDLLAVNFTKLSDEEFYNGLKQANGELIVDYYEKCKKESLEQIKDLYENKNEKFRGFRQK